MDSGFVWYCQELYNLQGAVFARIYNFDMKNPEFPNVKVHTVATADVANSTVQAGKFPASVGKEPAMFTFSPRLIARAGS